MREKLNTEKHRRMGKRKNEWPAK